MTLYDRTVVQAQEIVDQGHTSPGLSTRQLAHAVVFGNELAEANKRAGLAMEKRMLAAERRAEEAEARIASAWDDGWNEASEEASAIYGGQLPAPQGNPYSADSPDLTGLRVGDWVPRQSGPPSRATASSNGWNFSPTDADVALQFIGGQAEVLTVIESSRHSLLPYAYVTSGSVVQRHCWGISRWHALGRAVKWAKKNTDGQVFVSRWSDTPVSVPVTDHPDHQQYASSVRPMSSPCGEPGNA